MMARRPVCLLRSGGTPSEVEATSSTPLLSSSIAQPLATECSPHKEARSPLRAARADDDERHLGVTNEEKPYVSFLTLLHLG